MGAGEIKVWYFRSYAEIPDTLKKEVRKVLEEKENTGEYLQKLGDKKSMPTTKWKMKKSGLDTFDYIK